MTCQDSQSAYGVFDARALNMPPPRSTNDGDETLNVFTRLGRCVRVLRVACLSVTLFGGARSLYRCRKEDRQVGGLRLVVVVYYLLHLLVQMRLRQLQTERRTTQTVPFLTLGHVPSFLGPSIWTQPSMSMSMSRVRTAVRFFPEGAGPLWARAVTRGHAPLYEGSWTMM